MLPKVGEIFDERYELLELIGSGGNGTVFRARQLDLNRIVAVKILHAELMQDDDSQERFIREANLLSRIDHLNVVRIYHMGVSPSGFCYITMEFIEGPSLRAKLQHAEHLPLQAVVRMIRQIGNGLSAIHGQGVVHRDLKPENIILTDVPESDTVKLIDLGLARSILKDEVARTLTGTGTLIGTANYMSPEQAAGKVVDTRSDIYSLAVCLYEMLHGKLPFQADNPIGMLYQHINTPAPELLDSREPAARKLNAVFQKAMSKSVEQRYQSVDEFVADLDSTDFNFVSAGSRSGRRGKNLITNKLIAATWLGFLLLGAISLICFQAMRDRAKSEIKIEAKNSEQGLAVFQKNRIKVMGNTNPNLLKVQQKFDEYRAARRAGMLDLAIGKLLELRALNQKLSALYNPTYIKLSLCDCLFLAKRYKDCIAEAKSLAGKQLPEGSIAVNLDIPNPVSPEERRRTREITPTQIVYARICTAQSLHALKEDGAAVKVLEPLIHACDNDALAMRMLSVFMELRDKKLAHELVESMSDSDDLLSACLFTRRHGQVDLAEYCFTLAREKIAAESDSVLRSRTSYKDYADWFESEQCMLDFLRRKTAATEQLLNCVRKADLSIPSLSQHSKRDHMRFLLSDLKEAGLYQEEYEFATRILLAYRRLPVIPSLELELVTVMQADALLQLERDKEMLKCLGAQSCTWESILCPAENVALIIDSIAKGKRARQKGFVNLDGSELP